MNPIEYALNLYQTLFPSQVKYDPERTKEKVLGKYHKVMTSEKRDKLIEKVLAFEF